MSRKLLPCVIALTGLVGGCGGRGHDHPSPMPDAGPRSGGPDAAGDMQSTPATPSGDMGPAPAIRAFTAQPAPTPFGQDTTLVWELVKPVGASLRCVIHFDDGNVDDETIPDCPAAWHVTHQYAIPGAHAPTLTLYADEAQIDARQAMLEVIDGPHVEVVTPTPDAFVSTSVAVQARALGTEPIASVTATVNNATAVLEWSSSAGVYVGSVTLPSEPVIDLVVRAQTDSGKTAETTVRLYQALHAPTLTIRAPLTDTVARPMLDLDLGCEGETPGCTIAVKLVDDAGSQQTIARGTAELKTTVDLSRWDGSVRYLWIVASDEHGHTSTVFRPVYVESSAWYHELRALPEAILDADVTSTPWRFVRTDQRYPDVATANRSDFIGIVDPFAIALQADGDATATRLSDQLRRSDVPYYDDWARLVPGGVLFSTGSGPNSMATLTRSAGSSPMVWQTSEPGNVVVSGDYMTFSDAYRDVAMQLSTGLLLTTPVNAEAVGVSRDGVVAYSVSAPKQGKSCAELSANATLYLAGKAIASDASYHYFNVKTDGKIVAYEKVAFNGAGTACGFTVQPAVHDGSNETPIGPSIVSSGKTSINDGEVVKVSNGWAAFVPETDHVFTEVWRRSPAGVVERVANSQYQLALEDLGDDGSLVYSVSYPAANERVYVDASGASVVVGHALGRAFFSGGKWYALIGRSLLQLARPAGG